MTRWAPLVLLAGCVLHARRVEQMVNAGRIEDATAGAAALRDPVVTQHVIDQYVAHRPAVTLTLLPADQIPFQDPTYGTEWVVAQLVLHSRMSASPSLDAWLSLDAGGQHFEPCLPDRCDTGWLEARSGGVWATTGVADALGSLAEGLSMAFDLDGSLPQLAGLLDVVPEAPPAAPSLRRAAAQIAGAAPADAWQHWLAPECGQIGPCMRRFILLRDGAQRGTSHAHLRILWIQHTLGVEASFELPLSADGSPQEWVAPWSREPHALPSPTNAQIVRL